MKVLQLVFSACSNMENPSKLLFVYLNILLFEKREVILKFKVHIVHQSYVVDIFSESFHNVEPFRPEVYVAPGLVSSQAPYLVGLVETESPETIICAGSLLNYRWVLTLASCSQERKHDKKKYKAGGILRQKQNKTFFLNPTDCGAETR